VVAPLRERLAMHFARSRGKARWLPAGRKARWMLRLIAAALLTLVGYGAFRALLLIGRLGRADFATLATGLLATFVRVHAAILVGALWTVPIGVWIGTNNRLGRIAQPIAQIAASIPATAVFPVVLLLLIRMGGGLGIASLVLLLLGTQWYILFNVIAGALAIPTDLKEMADIYRLQRLQRWRRLTLPAIFPYLVTGLLSASGGAWNASIIAEYFHLGGRTFTVTGLGAVISRASEAGNFALLTAGTLAMALVVVAMNRLVWRPLYILSETRFKLEA
jgi:NitT/TauT family transport system permease protein